jgi:uncharacterized small protein (DUF1192 family)
MEEGSDIAWLIIVGAANSLLPFQPMTQEEARMDPEELEPKKPPVALRPLDPMSIDELEGYIGELETEITRVRGAIAAKKAVRSGADGLFKK